MSLARYRMEGQPQQKIRPDHLGRAAIVYVRQSSRQQVLEHSESTRLQYALAERAVALGWARSQVLVIDDDLGVSAATADSRKGFARLVTEVTMGRAGVVIGIEMSRLARTGRDWHQLLELCSLSGVLLADPDGVYDPGVYNDRLLLGLKGTMSEAELYLIRQRMLSGKLAKAERGELAVPLPIGYVRRPSGEVILDPDEQAQHVVRLVFGTFRRLGTLNGVLRYLVDQEVQLPVRVHSGPAKGELEWRRPNRETLQIMLHNPVYAGYYAYGRRQVEPRRKVPGRPDTGRVVKEASEWLVLLPGRMPAYITAGGVRGERRPDGRQPADRGHAGRAAGRLGAAVRAAALRPLRRAPHDGAATTTPASARSAHGYTCAFYQVNYGTGGQVPAHRRRRARRLRRRPGPGRGGAGRAGGLHGRRRPGRGRAGHAGQAVAAAAGARPLRRRPGPPPVPARRTGKPARHPAAGSRTGKPRSPRRPGWKRTTSGSPRSSRPTLTAAERAAIQALAADLPRVWDAPSTTPGRPQGAAAHPHRGHHRHRRRGQRAGRRHHHLGRRAPDHRAGRPPRRPPGPAVVLPRPPGPRHRARRSGPHQPGRSPTSSTPRDSGRPSGPAGSPASRSAP